MQKANATAPRPLTTQPATAFGPNGARLAGSMKMPEPIIVLTATAHVIQKPSCRLLLSMLKSLPLGFRGLPA